MNQQPTLRQQPHYENKLHHATAIYQRNERSPAAAAWLSFFFPGAGQAYNLEMGKAIPFLIFSVISFVLVLFGIGILMILIISLISIIDAYYGSKRYNDQLDRDLAELIQNELVEAH